MRAYNKVNTASNMRNIPLSHERSMENFLDTSIPDRKPAIKSRK